ncbi:uncharacterized protein VP01_6747g1 [Puccinia sorghi]|uniref:Uncharacterized protein n=1 Tax=Puccinia sorghi TaxID=27349 RepID=A0A0L6UGV8_9BASI|nr:uncharacterized protein VP01_6747g1 [Puccinia sorghi]
MNLLSNSNLRNITCFLMDGSSYRPLTQMDLHFLGGWQISMFTGYNCVVKMFMAYKNVVGGRPVRFPLLEAEIKGFCYWAVRSFISRPQSHNVLVSMVKYELIDKQDPLIANEH